MYKFSIITINFNDLNGLKKTVESVRSQTWQEFEYIVIDGGSTDGSKEYLESQNSKIDYWVSEPDKGIYNAMNKGINKASGEYLLFLNSGDHFFNNEVLEQNHESIQLKDIIYFNLNICDSGKSYIRQYPEELLFSYLIKDTLPHPATFINKKLFDKIGLYDEELKIVSDWKFFIECICKYNFSYLRINQTLSTFYLDGLSSDPKNFDLQFLEKERVLNSTFSTYLKDFAELNEMKLKVSDLRKSRKIQLLIKLGLLKKF